MTTTKTKPSKRRERVERNLYVRFDARGRKVFEVGFRDSSGAQRFRTVGPRLGAARIERDAILSEMGKGKRIEGDPRLKFGTAAETWLNEQVVDLRPRTRVSYEGAVRNHLEDRWSRRRMDSFDVRDCTRLIRELRSEGLGEWSIANVLKCARRIFRYAQRHLGWSGMNPIDALESSERPKLSASPRRRLFNGTELEETAAAATDPRIKALIAVLSVTGCRLSEALGLTWGDVDFDDMDDAGINFSYQLGLDGKRVALKTEQSQRRNVLPDDLAMLLAKMKAASSHSRKGSFVFCTRSGAAMSQRNVHRAIRLAMKAAKTEDGKPTFPALSAKDAKGKALPVPPGSVPTIHAIRHTAASRAIHDGESVEQVSFRLGHKNSIVTATVYVTEIKSAKKQAEEKAALTTRFGSVVSAAGRSNPQKPAQTESAEVVDLGTKRRARQ